MRKSSRLFIIIMMFALAGYAQPKESAERQLYFTQIKAAEAMLRLNETSEARALLEETAVSKRGLEWQLLYAMSDRSVRAFRGHAGSVAGIALSGDGKVLASGSEDSTIILWDAVSGEKLAVLKGHGGQVSSLDFSPDGRQLISGSSDASIKVWDLASRKEIKTIRKDFFRGIYQCRFSPDGKNIGLASWEFIRSQSPPVQGFAAVVSLESGEVIRRFNTDNHPAAAIDFSNDGNKLYTATWGFYVKQHDVATGSTGWVYDVSNVGYYTAFQSCDLSPDGSKIVTGGKDNQIRMIDAANGKLLYIIEPLKGHRSWVNAVRFSEDGKMFASAADDQVVKVWESATGKQLYSFVGHTSNINGLVFAGDNKTIYTSSSDGTIRKWDISKPGQFNFSACVSGPWNAPISPDGKWMAAACSDTVLNLWDIQEKKIVQSFNGASALSAAFNDNGRLLATGYSRLQIFDLVNRKLIANSSGHRGRITGLSWLQSKNLIASASADGSVRIWSEAGDSIRKIVPVTGIPYVVSFIPDQQKMVVGMTNGKVKLYSTRTWLETDSIKMGTTIFNLKIDPSGTYVATSGNKEAFVWNMKTNKLRRLDGHTNWVYGLAVHPLGRWVITTSYDQSLRIWELDSGRPALTLKQFNSQLYTVDITRDGKTLLVTEPDGLVYVFNL